MTSNDHRECADRLSDYVSGELDEADRTRIETHLAGCTTCRGVLSELEEVVALAHRAGALEPPHDLWPGIEAAIRSGSASAELRAGKVVIPLPTARGDAFAARRRLTAPRLAAAAVVLVAVTATATWQLASRTASTPTASSPPDVSFPVTGVAQQATLPAPPPGLAAELAVLQQVLDSARETLDPNTVLVLERNLNEIERAISDSKDALAVDPGNAFLREHLERMYQRKLIYLQDVARVVDWAG
jgi:anti-sigma factor RsiW